MNKYQNGKIYKLFCNESNLVYYGSTTQILKHRLCQHRTNKKGASISRIMINPQIELLEDYPCNSKKELEVRERFYIENNECINMKIPGRTKKECNQKYYQINKEKHNEYYKKKYKENMKDESFRIKKNDKGKIWREENPDYFKEKIECECGSIVNKFNLKKHKKTKKHLEFEAK